LTFGESSDNSLTNFWHNNCASTRFLSIFIHLIIVRKIIFYLLKKYDDIRIITINASKLYTRSNYYHKRDHINSNNIIYNKSTKYILLFLLVLLFFNIVSLRHGSSPLANTGTQLNTPSQLGLEYAHSNWNINLNNNNDINHIIQQTDQSSIQSNAIASNVNVFNYPIEVSSKLYYYYY